jgi:hypothetical protein
MLQAEAPQHVGGLNLSDNKPQQINSQLINRCPTNEPYSSYKTLARLSWGRRWAWRQRAGIGSWICTHKTETIRTQRRTIFRTEPGANPQFIFMTSSSFQYNTRPFLTGTWKLHVPKGHHSCMKGAPNSDNRVVGKKLSAVSYQSCGGNCSALPPNATHLAAVSLVICIPELAHGYFSMLMLISGSAMISRQRIQCTHWNFDDHFVKFPLLVCIYVAAHRPWHAEDHISWTMYQNRYRHCQCINWASHICSRGFPDSPFKRNNHDSDIIMVFSSIPLRYI